MQSLSKYNNGIKYLLCAIDLFSKYARAIPIKDKKGTSIVNAFKKILSDSNSSKAKTKGRKPNKIWVDQGSKFYNNTFKDFLKINNIKMYSTYNEGKSVVAERFIRTLKNKIFKHVTAISKNVNFGNIMLDNIVDKYNSTVHKTIKMKAIDVMGDSYAKYNENSSKKDPKFKVSDHVRVSQYKSIFAEGYTPNRSEEVFAISKIKNTTVPWTYVFNDLNGEEITESFYEEKELQKTSQKEFRREKVLKRKRDKLYFKWNEGIIIEGIIIALITGLIKKTFYKNEPILS